jgi:hypothetical protein
MLATELYYVAANKNRIVGKTNNQCYNDIIIKIVEAAREGKMFYIYEGIKLTHGCLNHLNRDGFKVEKKHIGNGLINYIISIPAPQYYPDHSSDCDINCMSHLHEEGF